MKRAFAFSFLIVLMLSGCDSTRRCDRAEQDTAWIKGSLCQAMVDQADKFYENNNRYPTADSLATMAVIRLYDTRYSIYRLPNLYTTPPDSLDRLLNFFYYAEKGVTIINIDYEYRDCHGRLQVGQGGVVKTNGQEAAQWYHTQMTCDLLLKCSRGEITATKAAQSVADWLSKMPVPADSLTTAVEDVRNYSLEVIELYINSGDFSESVTLGYAWEIADNFEEELNLLARLIRHP